MGRVAKHLPCRWKQKAHHELEHREGKQSTSAARQERGIHHPRLNGAVAAAETGQKEEQDILNKSMRCLMRQSVSRQREDPTLRQA